MQYYLYSQLLTPLNPSPRPTRAAMGTCCSHLNALVNNLDGGRRGSSPQSGPLQSSDLRRSWPHLIRNCCSHRRLVPNRNRRVRTTLACPSVSRVRRLPRPLKFKWDRCGPTSGDQCCPTYGYARRAHCLIAAVNRRWVLNWRRVLNRRRVLTRTRVLNRRRREI